MDLKRIPSGEIEIVEIGGEIDSYTSPKARDFFAEILKEQKKKLLIDFTDVGYISSAGLATFIEVFQKMHMYDGVLKLCCLNDTTRGIFEIAKLDSIFSIYKTREEAINAF